MTPQKRCWDERDPPSSVQRLFRQINHRMKMNLLRRSLQHCRDKGLPRCCPIKRWRFLPLVGLLVVQASHADWVYQTVAGSGGVPLNVVTAGDPGSPAVVFIHGIGQSHYSFVRQLDSDLADDLFMVSFDLRGHGGSGKPWSAEAYTQSSLWARDLAAVIAASGADRPVLVAWSYGTLVALDYVREFGTTDLAGIILTGALGALRPFKMSESDDPYAAQFARNRELQLSPSLIDNIRASEWGVGWLTATPMAAQDKQLFYAISLMFPAYARRAMVQRRVDNQDLLQRLSLPMLLSLGEKDNPAQLDDGAEMAAAHANIDLSVYAGAGHSVFFEQPERFNAELLRFVAHARSVLDPR
jgi:pimeloyl-ACP methyl ester carboxylesterase